MAGKQRDFGGLERGDDQAVLLNPGNKPLTHIVQDDSFREFEFRQYLFACQSKVCLWSSGVNFFSIGLEISRRHFICICMNYSDIFSLNLFIYYIDLALSYIHLFGLALHTYCNYPLAKL